jgi:hypothetical protein
MEVSGQPHVPGGRAGGTDCIHVLAPPESVWKLVTKEISHSPVGDRGGAQAMMMMMMIRFTVLLTEIRGRVWRILFFFVFQRTSLQISAQQ